MRIAHEVTGREGELAALGALVKDVASGRGAVALIEGEAGVGRTRLAREVMVRSSRSCAVAWSSAGAVRPGRSVGVSLIAQLADTPTRGVAGALDVAAAEGDPEECHRQVARVLRAAAGPVALFVDDVHMADRATCLMLDVLLRLAAEVPLLLVVTAKQERGADAREPRAWHFLRARPEVRGITLGRLPDEAITRMLRWSLPAADTRLVERVTTAARGNPRLAQSMALWTSQGGDPLVVDLPTDELVRSRVAACEHEGILAALALFARPVPTGLLAQATGHADTVVAWVLERAESAGVVARTGGEPGGAPSAAAYEPTHPLLGAGAVAALDRPQLDLARTEVAHAIADRRNSEAAAWNPAEIASLLVAAGDACDRAQDLCLQAALWCEAAELFDDAVRFASYALRHSHRCPERVTLLGVLGRSLTSRDRTGAADALHEAVTLADKLSHPGQYAQAVAEFVGLDVHAAGHGPEHVALLRSALERCPPGHTATEAGLRALLAETRFALSAGDRDAFAESRALASRALRLIDESSCTPAAKAPVRFIAIKFHLTPHGWGTVRTVVDAISAVGALHTRVLGLPAATALCLATGDAAGLASLEAEFASLTGSRDPAVRSALDHVRAARAVLAGQWDTLATLLPQLQPHWMTRNPEIAAATPRVFAAMWRGQTGRPLPPTALQQPPSQRLADLATLCLVAMAAPDGSGATSPAAEQLAARLASTPLPPEDCTWSTHLVLRARLAAITGETILARRACTELAPFQEQFAVFSWCVPFGPVGWYTAEALLMLGRTDDARAANHSAEQASRRLGARVWTARCLTQRARLFRVQDPVGAEAAREEALNIAEELDLAGLFLEAQRLSPSDAAKAPALGQAQLSAREREILRLIGRGLSNSQIATRIGLSVGTVERHCSNMYRKLRVRNRAQALSVAGNTGN